MSPSTADMRASPRGVDVAFVYRDLSLGGVQRMITNLANGLATDGHSIGICLVRHHSAHYTDLHSSIRVVRFQARTPVGAFLSIFRYLRKAKPKAVYTATPHFNIMCMIANAILGFPARVVISEHSDTEQEFRRMPWSLYKLSMLLIPLIYPYADQIVAVSSGTADSLSRFGRLQRKNIRVVFNPAFDEEILAQAAESLDHPWCDPKYRMIVAAGRLVPQKDFSTLIRSFAHLNRQHADTRLIILGEGDERTRLQTLIDELGQHENVSLPGSDTNPYRWFKRSRVFVLSSLWEGFGNVLVEALACGCTVVSTDCPSGPSEILGEGRWGELVPIGDAKALAAAIELALANPRDSDDCLRRARQFGSEAMISLHKKLLFPSP